ncbi:MAG: isoprenyl transferase [Muribaculaceae bacterium]|nr:isoprenyl transferase [Muribaculaceae bacterium]
MTKTTDIANTSNTEITVDMTRVPDHVAVIMDGNGRWAQSRGLDRTAGHVEGVVAVRRVTEAASRLGIKYLTLYTFSTENWNRPKEEVDALMHLIVTAIERETPDLIKNNVRMTVIGDMSRMPELAFKRLSKCVEETSHCTGLTLVLAISYSSRWEIREAVRKIASKAVAGEIDAASVTDEDVASALATSGMPDPDLLIRTGGDFRVSNFLLYQIAYTEIYLTPTYWPDFDDTELKKAVVAYQSRQRRFGLTGEQVEGQQ